MSTIRDFSRAARAAIQAEITADEARYVVANPADVTTRARDQGQMRGMKRAAAIIQETLSRSIDGDDPEDKDA